MPVIDRRRVKQLKSEVVIVHRRKGRERVRSYYDRQFGHIGKWRTLCSVYTTYGVNTTTNDAEVTCMHCLKRMGEL